VGAVLASGLLPCSPAFAKLYTLEDAVRLALNNNFNVALAQGDLAGARADVTGARSVFFPNLSVNGSWTYSEPEIFFNSDLGVFTRAPNESWFGSANANLLLFDGLGNYARLSEAKNRRSAEQSEYLKAKQDVAYETELRYLDVLKKEYLLRVQDEAVHLSEEQLKKTRAMKDLGASTQADVFKAEVDYSNNRLAALRAERDLNVSRATLANYVGIDPRESIEVRDEGPPPEFSNDPAAAAAKALEIHPSLLAARSAVESSEQGVKLAKSDRWPAFSLYGNINYSDIFDLDKPTDSNTQWSYGARMSFTIFDGLLTKANINRAQASLVTQQRFAESEQRDVLLAVQQAVLDADLAQESITVAQEAVKSSEEDLRLAEERYKVGEGTILEVIDAQVNLTRVKTDLVNAAADHRLSISRLRNAVGDLPVPENGE
jgi:outer membrane protein TolC